MKVNVFDTYKVIKDKAGYKDFDETLLQVLDDMLNQYGVVHAFMEPRKEDIEADEDSVVTVVYKGEDDTKFFLVYALFISTYRGAEADLIKKAMLKHCAE